MNPASKAVGALLALGLVVATAVGGWYVVREIGPGFLPDRCEATVGDLTVELTPEQAENAALIAAIGVRRGLPARAVSIARSARSRSGRSSGANSSPAAAHSARRSSPSARVGTTCGAPPRVFTARSSSQTCQPPSTARSVASFQNRFTASAASSAWQAGRAR